MTSNKNIGDRGEALAISFLKKNNYQILEQNYRFKRSEIDIIAEKNGILLFIEVKTRNSSTYGYPEDFVDDKKAEKVHEGAEQYMCEKEWEGPIRFDILSVLFDRKGKEEIMYFEDAF